MRENRTHHITQYFLALLAACLFTTTPLAQSPASLRGQVVDETGAVIPGAQLTLGAVDGKPRTVTTNANGEFTLSNITPGTYKLTAAFEGFQPFIQNDLRVTATNAPLKITLSIASVAMETT